VQRFITGEARTPSFGVCEVSGPDVLRTLRVPRRVALMWMQTMRREVRRQDQLMIRVSACQAF
jgi:hypothetical protein